MVVVAGVPWVPCKVPLPPCATVPGRICAVNVDGIVPEHTAVAFTGTGLCKLVNGTNKLGAANDTLVPPTPGHAAPNVHKNDGAWIRSTFCVPNCARFVANGKVLLNTGLGAPVDNVENPRVQPTPPITALHGRAGYALGSWAKMVNESNPLPPGDGNTGFVTVPALNTKQVMTTFGDLIRKLSPALTTFVAVVGNNVNTLLTNENHFKFAACPTVGTAANATTANANTTGPINLRDITTTPISKFGLALTALRAAVDHQGGKPAELRQQQTQRSFPDNTNTSQQSRSDKSEQHTQPTPTSAVTISHAPYPPILPPRNTIPSPCLK
jgi:hypothetical protein